MLPTLLLSFLATACDAAVSNTVGSGTAIGSMGMTGFDVGTTVAAVETAAGEQPCGSDSDAGIPCTAISSIIVWVVNLPGLTCATIDVTERANIQALELAVEFNPGVTDPRGEYQSNVQYWTLGPSCYGGGRELSTAGTITISDFSSDHVVGSYALTFPSGELSGTFDASVCPQDVPTGAVDHLVMCI